MVRKVLFATVLLAMMVAIATPVRSTVGARNGFYMENESGPIPKGYTERSVLVVTNYQRGLIGIDSGIYCPQEGDVWIECDYVQKYSLYAPISGLFPILGNSMGLRAYGYRRMIFNLGQYGSGIFYFENADWDFYSSPIRCGYGIIGENDVIMVNGEIATHTLVGGERGNGNQTIWFGKCASTWDDGRNTKLGVMRIYLSGVCVFEGIPCSRDSDGKAGYYDTVGVRFCPDQGGIGWMDLEEGE